MNNREKLIELLKKINYETADIKCEVGEEWGVLADHLIANGVVVREKGEWEPVLNECGQQYNEEIYENVWRCPVCGEETFRRNFCPNCGADMRKGRTDV